MSQRLDIRILGPLEVERGGALVKVGGPKAQMLLGVLALRADTVVAIEDLVSAMWGEDAPGEPLPTIQVYISKFRRAALAGEASIERVEPGYVLRIDPGQVDAHRFERTVEEGNAAFGRGDLHRAIDHLDRALALWRGEPLAGIDMQAPVRADIAALEGRQIAALETRFEARLGSGEAGGLIPELELLLAEHPMNERLHALTMLALVRAGRQSEALELAARLRHRVSKELGIDPGESLLELERRILQGDPTLQLAVPEIEDTGVGDGQGPTRTSRKTVAALVVRVGAADQRGGAPDPEVSRDAIESLEAEARSAVGRHGGLVHSTVAGTIVAVFGIPAVHEDDAARAIRAAVEIHERAISSVATDDSPGWQIEVRAAVAAGEVLAEEDAGTQRLVSAGPVEEAHELVQRAMPGETLLTPVAYRLSRHEVGAEPAKLVLVGDEPVSGVTFRLNAVTPLGTARRLSSPLVGRQEELRLLRETLARVVRERACSMVTILGAAGVGKSRLVSEFLADLDGMAEVLSGRCLPYGRDMTYWPVADIVRQLAGLTPADGARKVKSRVAKLIEGEPDAGFLTRRVAGILGAEDLTATSDEIFWAVRKVLEVQARRRPFVVVFDDIHWADTTLLDLIEHIVAWTRDAPILLVAMSRPELTDQRGGWGGGNLRASNLTLSALTRDESETLIGSLLGAAELAPRAKQRIVDIAEGHPLHLEELLSMLIDDGLIALEDGSWIPTRDLSDVTIPLTVQTLLSSRLDRLAAGERGLLESAAVIGNEFSERDLRELCDRDDDLATTLDGLARKDLLVPERLSRVEGHTYRFRHILIRDVVYRSSSKEGRARAHERFGEILEGRAGAHLGEREEIVGYHFEAAWRLRRELGTDAELTWAMAGRAGERLEAAGRRAFARGDAAATVGLLGRALELCNEGDPRLPEIALMLGVAMLETGDMCRAEVIFGDGLAAAERHADERLRWRLWIERADLQLWRGPESLDTEALDRRCEEAISAFERLGDRSGVARACRMIGDARGARGRFGEASEWYVRGREAALAAGDAKEAGERPTLGALHGPTPLGEAIELVTTSLDDLERPNPEMLAVLGTLEGLRGRVPEGRRLLERSLADAEEMGSAWRVPTIRMMSGMLLLAADAFEEAEETLRLAVEAFQTMGERYQFPTAAAMQAHAFYGLGRLDEALAATEMSEEIASPHDVASMVLLRTARAKVYAARGDATAAEALAREAVEQADLSDMLIIRADAHRDLAIVLEGRGKRDEGIAELHEALDLYRRKGHILGAERTGAELDRVTVASGGTAGGVPV